MAKVRVKRRVPTIERVRNTGVPTTEQVRRQKLLSADRARGGFLSPALSAASPLGITTDSVGDQMIIQEMELERRLPIGEVEMLPTEVTDLRTGKKSIATGRKSTVRKRK